MKKTIHLISSDQIKLSLDIYPIDKEKASVLIVHGLGEYKGRYKHIAAAFNEENYSAYALDMRGHGDSEGPKGYSPSFQQLLDDLKLAIDKVYSENKPLFLYGHSLGGNVVANYLIHNDDKRIKAAIITSPWFTLKMKASLLKLALGHLMLKIFPKFTQNSNLNPNNLSQDEAVAKEYREDPKVHQKITAAMFFGVRKAGLFAIANSEKINIPVLLSHGTGDKITDPDATKEFGEKAGSNVTLKLWPDMYHETHNEIEKDKVIEYNINWLNQQLRST